MTAADRDKIVLLITALAEARGEGAMGLRAQIHSVLNRHAAGKWYSRKNLAACCLAPYAYSCYSASDQNDTVAAELDWDLPVVAMAINEVEMALAGKTADPTDGATHYYAAATKEPDWVSGISNGKQVAPPAVFTVQIGAHKFFKGVA